MDESINCSYCGRTLKNSNTTCMYCLTNGTSKKPLINLTDRKVGVGEALLCFSFPLWGTVLFVALSCILKADLFVFVGGLLGLLSAYPIFSSKSIGIILKMIFSLIYYFVGVFIIFFVGWASICQFCPSCH